MREKRGFPLVDDQGRIRIETVNALSFENLRNWIKAVLRGEDPGAGGDKEELPYGFLKRIYNQLDPHVREAFEDAVLYHLADLAQDPESGWWGESADEVLLLVAAVFRGSHRARAPIDLLLYMSEQDRFRQTEAPNLHWRVLQTLVGVRHRAHREFWYEQYRIGGDMYALVVLAGLSLTSLSVAIEWVREEAPKDAVISALFSRLPWLVEEYGADKVASLLYDLPPVLHKSQRVELRELEHRLGLNLGKPQSEILAHFKKKEIKKLGQKLHIDLSIEPETASGLRRELEERLRGVAANRQQLREPTVDSEVIIGLDTLLGDRGVELSLPYRQKVWKYGREVIDRMGQDEDAFPLMSALYTIYASGRDLDRELQERMALQ